MLAIYVAYAIATIAFGIAVIPFVTVAIAFAILAIAYVIASYIVGMRLLCRNNFGNNRL